MWHLYGPPSQAVFTRFIPSRSGNTGFLDVGRYSAYSHYACGENERVPALFSIRIETIVPLDGLEMPTSSHFGLLKCSTMSGEL